jgi:hypothetical protein
MNKTPKWKLVMQSLEKIITSCIFGSILLATALIVHASENSCCSKRTVKGVTFVIDYPCRHPKRALSLSDSLDVEQLKILETNLQGIACFINLLSDYRAGDEILIKKEVRYPINYFSINEDLKSKTIIPVRHMINWNINEESIKFQVAYFISNPKYSIFAGTFLNRKQNLYYYFVDNYVFERSTHDITVYRFKEHLNNNHRIFTDEKALDQYLSEGLQ